MNTSVKRTKRVHLVVEVSLDQIPDEPSMDYEPYTILAKKIETLCEITGCTERDAQLMILEML